VEKALKRQYKPDLENANVKRKTLHVNVKTFSMALIHEGSCACAKSELDLFSVPATQMSVELRSGNYVKYHTIDGMGVTPSQFDVTASGDDYLDFANSFICVRAKITRVNDDVLDAADLTIIIIKNDDFYSVGPVNNSLHSPFSQVDVSPNGIFIKSSTNTYDLH